MSFHSSPFGAAQEPAPEPAAEEENPTREVDPRVVKSLLAGAALVAVLGAGTAGFLWLSSTPSGEAAEAALSGASSTPSVTGSAAAVARAGAIDFSGRDAFAATVGVVPDDSDEEAVEAAASTTSTTVSTAGTGSSSTGTVSNGGGSTGVQAVVTVPASTTTVAASSTSTSAAPVPSDTRSTAPGWTVPQVSFVTGTAAFGTFRIAGEDVRIARGDLVYPLGIRYGGLVASDEATTPTETSDDSVPAVKAVFTAENDAQTGWVITSDPEGKVLLPDAVVGHPQGRARAYGVLADRVWIRVDREQGALYSEGESVGDTGLTFLGTEPDDESLPNAGVYFQDGSGIVYFGKFGGGESDGVAF
ncbi:hypothetical protein [Kineococcus arenarius]|uniref:hypothetical protein n=1 Tax=Kineococcus sp. SYSU DK007 TaxID=3383128 RepID=UPI003D7DCF34